MTARVRARPVPLSVWLKALRLPFISITVVTVVFGTVLAANEPGVALNVPIALLAFCSALLFHLGSNVINDYFDDRIGTDRINTEFIAPFCGGSRLIQEGKLSRGQTLRYAVILYVLALLSGIGLLLLRGPELILFGIVGLFLGIAYSAFLARLFFGELAVGVAFGVLMVGGSYWVQTGALPLRVLVYSLPATFLSMLIIWINQFPDFKADAASGKRNLVVRLGRRRAAIGYLVLVGLAYGSLVLIASLYNRLFFIALATLPGAVTVAVLLFRNNQKISAVPYLLPVTIILHHTTLTLGIGAFLITLVAPPVGVAVAVLAGCVGYGALFKGIAGG